MDVDGVRKNIDQIDYEVMALMKRRMELGLRLKKLKNSICEPEREKKVLENVRQYSHGVITPEFSERLYREIMEESKRLQQQELKLAGFQGEHGAYSEVASLVYDPSLVPIPCKEFQEVFDEVATGQLDFGIVPVENSLEGAVTQVNDLLTETDLKIVGEIHIPIHHALLALPETEYQDLRIVYSHPQALGQCRGFIAGHKLEARPFYDTAGAARMLSEERPEAAGVIAHKFCAELYHLEIIKENIEDHESNATRFVLLSRKESAEQGDKCSIIFSIAHEAGALFSILKIFSDRRISLTRIESRPVRTGLGNYTFFLDFEGSNKDEKVINALMDVEQNTVKYKFLGCYRGRKA
ncbi:MAG: prephenate dehydratase [Syntrophus sp. (in: bacteria)]|nr:prephenate dehydratase [Syntrophus sp. (in: bacteria)]